MATWPGSLPQSFDGGGDYQETPEMTVLRTTMDTGITKMRRRQTRGEARVSGTMTMTTEQVASFVSFFQETIKGGSLAFTGSLGRLGTLSTYIFAENPAIQHLGGRIYQVNLRLTVLPQ